MEWHCKIRSCNFRSETAEGPSINNVGNFSGFLTPPSPQIREQMSRPDLHVFTFKFLALKNFPKFFWRLVTFILCNFSVRTLKYFQKNFKLIFCTQKLKKNGPQKLLIIGPDPFIPQSSPGHSPQPKIDSPYHEISGPDICSLICGTVVPL